MPEPTNTPATEPAPTGGAPTGGAPSTNEPAPTGQAPRWEGEFNPERAATLVENLRKELADEKAKRKTREDAEKSDLQRAQDRTAELETELSKTRTESLISAAVTRHKLPDDLAAFVSGATAEEIEAKAAALAKHIPAPNTPPPTPAGRPQSRLVPGSAPTTTGGDGFDANAVARAARRY